MGRAVERCGDVGGVGDEAVEFGGGDQAGTINANGANRDTGCLGIFGHGWGDGHGNRRCWWAGHLQAVVAFLLQGTGTGRGLGLGSTAGEAGREGMLSGAAEAPCSAE